MTSFNQLQQSDSEVEFDSALESNLFNSALESNLFNFSLPVQLKLICFSSYCRHRAQRDISLISYTSLTNSGISPNFGSLGLTRIEFENSFEKHSSGPLLQHHLLVF